MRSLSTCCGANHSRLESITYPSGYVLTHNYASGLNDDISRLSSLSDSGVTLESYDYLGLGTVVRRSHPQPGVDLTYIGSPGDAGDQYAGLDRFGRIVDQRWTDGTTDVDRYQYGYDRAGNRTYRENTVNSALSEVYSYDGLSQLTGFERGTLNGSKDGITGTVARSQEWDYDALGNWNSVTTDGGSPETRTQGWIAPAMWWNKPGQSGGSISHWCIHESVLPPLCAMVRSGSLIGKLNSISDRVV